MDYTSYPTKEFLSTPSVRRATGALAELSQMTLISIHALREEGDSSAGRPADAGRHFYPRPP